MSSVDVAIVGGGPAGAATACGLAAAGHRALVFESVATPHHKVCGEFLSPEAVYYLRRLAVDPRVLGAVPIERLTVVSAGRSGSIRLPFRAWSVSRMRLDAAILDRAAREGAEVRRGVSVRSAVPLAPGWELALSDGTGIRCRNLVLATGKRGLRGIPDRRDRGMVGLKMHLRPSATTLRALDGRVALFALCGGYAGPEPVEGGIVNLCLILRREIVARLAPGWPPLRDHLRKLCPVLGEQLAGMTALWPRPLAIVCPAGGYLSRAATADHLYAVGDRFAHLPPFAGDGLAAALTTAALAVEHVGAGSGAAEYLAQARAQLLPAIGWAGLLSRLAASHLGRQALGAAALHIPRIFAAAALHTRLAVVPHRSQGNGEISPTIRKGGNEACLGL